MNQVRFGIFGTLAIGLISLAGCSGDGDQADTVPVSGTVMYKGKPVEGATVVFSIEGASQRAQGLTDAKGKFKLTTLEADDGAVPGKYVVSISKVEGSTQSNVDTDALMNDPTKLAGQYQKEEKQKKKGGPKSLIPKIYGDLKTTPLKETVTEGGKNNFVFQLKG